MSANGNEKGVMGVIGDVVQEKIAALQWERVLAATAAGAALGAAYSVIDQTVLSAPRVSPLPYMSARLASTMPDVVDRMEAFYKLRALVAGDRAKARFTEFAVQALRQSEVVGIAYDDVVSGARELVTPNMGALRLWTQTRQHVHVIVRTLRSMLVLVNRPKDLKVETAFNELYEAYQNRLFVMHQRIAAT